VPTSAAAVRGFTVVLPHGLSFGRRRTGKGLAIAVYVSGARGVSLSLSHGRLVIKLRNAAAGFTVRIDARGLSESSALKSRAMAHKLPRMVLSVIMTNTAGKRVTLRVRLNH
jgi:hypothetical protein